MGWQWHQLDHMQIICTLLQIDNNASTSPLCFYRLDALPAAYPTASMHWRQFLLTEISEFWWHTADVEQISNKASRHEFSAEWSCMMLCAQIWVSSVHSASGYFTVYGDETSTEDHFDAHLATGDTLSQYCRTGYVGFVRRTEMTQSDGGDTYDVFC